jgi:hypothetical protein
MMVLAFHDLVAAIPDASSAPRSRSVSLVSRLPP